jgi:Secretion system C-terminal sorting domain
MKSMILIFVVVASLTSTTNAQIPNSGFETWAYYSYGGPNPDIVLKPGHWTGSNNHGMFSLERDSASFPVGTGQFSMIITSSISKNVNGAALSYDTLPQALLPNNIPPAFPVNFRPKSFCLYYKYLSIGGDSMTATCYFYKNGSKIGGAGYASAQNVSSWSPLTLPVTFSTSDIPDSATIILTTFYNVQHDGSALSVDNFSFDNLIVTSAPLFSSEIPGKYTLAQNYPNPFNPSTIIRFTVPSNGRAELRIFNVLGQEVATLFSDEAAAGVSHQVQFNASNLASGIYFSQLEFGGTIQVKKMLLLR